MNSQGGLFLECFYVRPWDKRVKNWIEVLKVGDSSWLGWQSVIDCWQWNGFFWTKACPRKTHLIAFWVATKKLAERRSFFHWNTLKLNIVFPSSETCKNRRHRLRRRRRRYRNLRSVFLRSATRRSASSRSVFRSWVIGVRDVVKSISAFLVATERPYKRVCPSVGRSVGWSVRDATGKTLL